MAGVPPATSDTFLKGAKNAAQFPEEGSPANGLFRINLWKPRNSRIVVYCVEQTIHAFL